MCRNTDDDLVAEPATISALHACNHEDLPRLPEEQVTASVIPIVERLLQVGGSAIAENQIDGML